MYGRTVRNSTSGRALGSLRWTYSAVGNSSASVTMTVPMASLMLSHNVGAKPGSWNASVSALSDQRSQIVDQFSRGIGTFCNANRVIDSSGAMKKIAAPISTRLGPILPNRGPRRERGTGAGAGVSVGAGVITSAIVQPSFAASGSHPSRPP